MPQTLRFDTQGRRLLERFLAERGLKQADFAKKTGLTQQTVSDYVAGETRPENHLTRALIERVTGIDCSAWFLPHERKRIRDLRAA